MKCNGCHREVKQTKPAKVFASTLLLCVSCMDFADAIKVAQEERQFRAELRAKRIEQSAKCKGKKGGKENGQHI